MLKLLALGWSVFFLTCSYKSYHIADVVFHRAENFNQITIRHDGLLVLPVKKTERLGSIAFPTALDFFNLINKKRQDISIKLFKSESKSKKFSVEEFWVSRVAALNSADSLLGKQMQSLNQHFDCRYILFLDILEHYVVINKSGRVSLNNHVLAEVWDSQTGRLVWRCHAVAKSLGGKSKSRLPEVRAITLLTYKKIIESLPKDPRADLYIKKNEDW